MILLLKILSVLIMAWIEFILLVNLSMQILAQILVNSWAELYYLNLAIAIQN